MLCPNCGNYIDEDEQVCPYCDISNSRGKTHTMDDWYRRKSEEKRQYSLRNQEDIERRVQEKKDRMKAEQAKIGLDRMIADLEKSVKPAAEESRDREIQNENISMGPTARLTEKDLDELISILTKDKKKQVRARMKQ